MKEEDGVIVEFMAMGHVVKVTAIDAATLREVSIVGAAKAPQKELAELAVRKLRYVLRREASS